MKTVRSICNYCGDGATQHISDNIGEINYPCANPACHGRARWIEGINPEWLALENKPHGEMLINKDSYKMLKDMKEPKPFPS